MYQQVRTAFVHGLMNNEVNMVDSTKTTEKVSTSSIVLDLDKQKSSIEKEDIVDSDQFIEPLKITASRQSAQKSMFGDEYGVSYYILCVLLVGQLINVFNGCNGWLLNLTGNENITAKTFYLAIGINLGLGAFLVRDYGALGVAVSSSVALVSWNFVLTYYCFNKIKINPTILPLRKMV